MSKTRKRHSTKVVQTPTKEAILQEVEQIDLLTVPNDVPGQSNVQGDERETYRSQSSEVASLSSRLGISGRSPKDHPSISRLDREAYEKMGCGELVGPLTSLVTSPDEHTLNLNELSLLELDMKCMEWCRNNTSKNHLVMWRPDYVDTLVGRLCTEAAPFPHYSIKFFLQHGRISDKENVLLEKILGVNDLQLLFNYLQYVPDLQESGIIKCLEYIIHADYHVPGFSAQRLETYDIKELLLWHVFGLDVDVPCLRWALISLSEPDRMICLRSLQKILGCYSDAPTPSFEPLKLSRGLSVHLPSKPMICKWLAALLDSLYPGIVFDISVEDTLQQLQQTVERDIRVSSGYEQVRTLLSSLINGRRSRVPRLEKQSSTHTALYIVEPVYF